MYPSRPSSVETSENILCVIFLKIFRFKNYLRYCKTFCEEIYNRFHKVDVSIYQSL